MTTYLTFECRGILTCHQLNTYMSKQLTDFLYDSSVDGLFYLSHITGLTYREINVVVFCIAEPLLYLIMLIIIIKQKIKLNHHLN
jgi:hypothetical protein